VKEKIEELLKSLVAGIDLTSKALVDEGYITSITMVQLICELDIAFCLEIDFESLTKGNFQSVEAIAKMVEREKKRVESRN